MSNKQRQVERCSRSTYVNFPAAYRGNLDPVGATQDAYVHSHPFNQEIFGIYQIQVQPANEIELADGAVVPDYGVVITDPILADAGGLMPAYDPSGKSAHEYPCMVMLAKNAYDEDITLIVPVDVHPGGRNLDPAALTNVRLTPEFLQRLRPADRQTAMATGKVATLEPLTVAELASVVGELKDIEFYTFDPHCKWPSGFAPEIQALIDLERASLAQQMEDGEVIPEGKLFVVPKSTLDMNHPNNPMGWGGNGFSELILNMFNGFPWGGNYMGYRTVVVGGTSVGYTIDWGVRNLISLGMNVHVLASSSFGIPTGYSKLVFLAPLRQNLPTRIHISYRWQEEWMGPQPIFHDGRTYNQHAFRVLMHDRELHANSLGNGLSNQLRFLDGSEGLVIEDWDPGVWTQEERNGW